jgi:hypothetical protein
LRQLREKKRCGNQAIALAERKEAARHSRDHTGQNKRSGKRKRSSAAFKGIVLAKKKISGVAFKEIALAKKKRSGVAFKGFSWEEKFVAPLIAAPNGEMRK